jgi:hypothetical protein
MHNIQTHHIETEWSPTSANTIRATCTRCLTFFSSNPITDTSWEAVRNAEQQARAPFDEYPCFQADAESVKRYNQREINQ